MVSNVAYIFKCFNVFIHHYVVMRVCNKEIIMGCTFSSDEFLLAQNKELKEYLSKKDIQLIQQSWGFIQDDVEHVGLLMFQR